MARTSRLRPLPLRSYQIEHQGEFLRHFAGYLAGGPAALGYEAPMGSGKTTTVKSLAANLLATDGARLVVVAAPLNAIVDQWAVLGWYAVPGLAGCAWRLPPLGPPNGQDAKPAPRATAAQLRDPRWWATARGFYVTSRAALCSVKTHAALETAPPALRSVLVVGDEGHHHHDQAQAGAFFAFLRTLGAATLLVSGTPWHGEESIFTPDTQVVSMSAAALAQHVDPSTGFGYAPRNWRIERVVVADLLATRAEEVMEPEVGADALQSSPKFIRGMCRATAEKWVTLGCPRSVINVPGAVAWKDRIVAELERVAPAALGRPIRIVDFIGEMKDRVRDERQAALARDGAATTYDHPDRIDVVISCARMDEGTDWPPCSHVFNIRIPVSPLRVLQRWARASRGKRKIAGYPEQWVDSQTMVFVTAALTTEAADEVWKRGREHAVLLAAYLADYKAAAEWIDPRCFATPDGAWMRNAGRKLPRGVHLGPQHAPAANDGDRRGGTAMERARATVDIIERIQRRGPTGALKIAELDAALAASMPDVSGPARKFALLALARGEEVAGAVAAARRKADEAALRGVPALRVREELQADLDRLVAEFAHFEVKAPEDWAEQVMQFTALDATAVAERLRDGVRDTELNAQGLVAFEKEYGHWPRRNATNPLERRLAIVLNSMRKNQRAVLTRYAIPLTAPQYDSAYQEGRARKIKAFYEEKGYWPRVTAKDSYEKELGVALNTLRYSHPEVLTLLDIPLKADRSSNAKARQAVGVPDLGWVHRRANAALAA